MQSHMLDALRIVFGYRSALPATFLAALLMLAGNAIGQETGTTPEATETEAPNSAELFEEGEAAIQSGDFGTALERFDFLVQALQNFRPTTATEAAQAPQFLRLAITGRGRALAGLEEYDAALGAFKEVTDSDPNFLPTLVARGQLFLQLGAPDQALADFQAAVAARRSNPDALFGLGKSYILLRGYQQGVRPLTRFIEQVPDNAEAFRLRGDGHAGMFDFDEAMEDYRRALRLDPEDHLTYASMAVTYLRTEDYASAVGALKESISRYTPLPGQEGVPYVQGYLMQSATYLELGKVAEDEVTRKREYQNALDVVNEVLEELDPKSPITAPYRSATLYSRGIAERMVGDFGGAVRSFSEAISLNPEMGEAYFRRGICFHHLGEDKMAIADFKQAANINFDDPRSNLWEGFMHAKLGDYYQAVRAYGDALSASDRYVPAYVNRGLAYMMLGEFEKAINDFNEAIRLEPTGAETYFKRGVAHQRLGDFDKASGSFANAIEIDGAHGPAHRHMAEVMRAIGNAELAEQYRARAAELEPQRGAEASPQSASSEG